MKERVSHLWTLLPARVVGCSRRRRRRALEGHGSGLISCSSAPNDPACSGRRRPTPWSDPFNLNFEGEAQHCPDQHDYTEHEDICERWRYCDGPNEVSSYQNLQSEQDDSPERLPKYPICQPKVSCSALKAHGYTGGDEQTDQEHQCPNHLKQLRNVLHRRRKGHLASLGAPVRSVGDAGSGRRSSIGQRARGVLA